uniref:RYYR-CCHC domain-containing protein n=1 Tax=Romanomermis culicivorax TaxID=13658 RepID=A0A915HFT0_ROMCU
MDYGEADFILSSKLANSVISYQSLNHPERFYQFSKKSSRLLSNGLVNEYWECIDCKKIKRQNGVQENENYSTIIVCGNRIKKNPDIGHHSDCTGRNFGETNALILNREARDSCKRGNKRPLEAHTSMNSEVPKRFRQADEADNCWRGEGKIGEEAYLNLLKFVSRLNSPIYYRLWVKLPSQQQRYPVIIQNVLYSIYFDIDYFIVYSIADFASDDYIPVTWPIQQKH